MRHSNRMKRVMDGQKLKRDAIKVLLSPWLRWRPLDEPRDGFSIVLGVPWALRHLLPVNLQFVARTDLRHLHHIHIVFDRVRQPDSEAFEARIRERFDELPLSFGFHPPITGRLVELVNQSKFYASMNWMLGLAQCETRYAVLHDFDLYPLVPNYFTSLVEAMRSRELRFTGIEHTHFDGLDTSHALIGTWALGIDVAWLRQNYRPIDCFHTVEYIAGQRFDLDAFTHVQSMTPQRDLAGTVTERDMAHVRNLVSTHLRFNKGEHFDVVWRLHQLWYLEDLCGRHERLNEVRQLMDTAHVPSLAVDGAIADFSNTHVTCANVLRDQVLPMECFLFGQPRSEVLRYLESFERFLWRHGSSKSIVDDDGHVRWRPDTARSLAQ